MSQVAELTQWFGYDAIVGIALNVFRLGADDEESDIRG